MPKKGILGCSFPVFIVVLLVLLGLIIIGFLAGPIGKSVLPGIHSALPDWIKVSQPVIELPAEPIFHIGGFTVTNSVIGFWITIVVLVGLMYIAFRRPKIVPKGIQNFMEFVLGYIYDFCISVAGEKNGRQFFPLVVTIFLAVIANAWLSLIPGFGSIIVHEGEGMVPLLRGANTDLNFPLAIAIYSFCFTTYFGFKNNKLGYFGKFLNFKPLFHGLKLLFTQPKAAPMAIFNGIVMGAVGFLEGLSEIIHIVSFTFRLFGNMTAGEILLLMVTFLVPFIFVDVFYGLELLVGFIQALIFAGLTLVFTTVAAASHDHQEAH